MITEAIIEQVIDAQEKVNKPEIILREKAISSNTKRVLVITGIRWCGKSTFLHQISGFK